MSPDVIRESSSVKISCETPADVIVNLCYFYTNREEKNIKPSFRCELDLTGAEVLRWASVKSPESFNIYCYYTIDVQGPSISSSDSDPATVKVGEIFHCCSSVLETVIAVFLLIMDYFTLNGLTWETHHQLVMTMMIFSIHAGLNLRNNSLLKTDFPGNLLSYISRPPIQDKQHCKGNHG